jgi:hypothetical protein
MVMKIDKLCTASGFSETRVNSPTAYHGGGVTLLPDPGPVGKVLTDLEGCDDEADAAAVFAGVQGAGGCAPSGAGATQASVAAELGMTPTQLKTWRLELEAAGSASAQPDQFARLGLLPLYRQDNKRLKEEVEVVHNHCTVVLGPRIYHGFVAVRKE